MTPREKAIERFWPKVDKTPGHGPAGDCWLWTASQRGHLNTFYGGFWYGGRMWRAHRFAYELVKGPVPAGLIVRHTCDNPTCCNPEHLIIGTHRENSRDCVDRGRNRTIKGEAHRSAISTAEDVRHIRRLVKGGMAQRRVAQHLGISHSRVTSAIYDWRHIGDEAPCQSALREGE